MSKKTSVLILLVFLAVAMYSIPHLSVQWRDSVKPSASKLSDFAEKKKIWVCPMHAQIVQAFPGSCPICGMDLVEAKDADHHEHGIHVDSSSIQKMGVAIGRVKKSLISREIRTYGNVVVDEDTIFNIHSKFEGSIKKLYVHSLGQKIQKGQAIYDIYSPELIARQKDYLRYLEKRKQLLQTVSGDALINENEYVMEQFQELAHERARFLQDDIGVESIQLLEDKNQAQDIVPILAAKSGIVTQINVRAGSQVNPSMPLLTMADVSKVWIDIALYPDQAGVKIGDMVTVKTADGAEIRSTISFISPVAENNKIKARAVVGNDKLLLRPGSYVDVIIRTEPHEALVLPRSAVMHTGEGSMVILSRGNGHFLPVYVDTGVESGDMIEIADGLAEGASVAVNGQFLLDSASSLAATAERMRPK